MDMDKALERVYKGTLLSFAVVGTIVTVSLYFPRTFMSKEASAEGIRALDQKIESVRAENHRLDEAQVRLEKNLRDDVGEIRRDVKTLLERSVRIRAGL